MYAKHVMPNNKTDRHTIVKHREIPIIEMKLSTNTLQIDVCIFIYYDYRLKMADFFAHAWQYNNYFQRINLYK